jgi:glycosyltransferase involved in cell wall biosynthesis
VRIGLIAPPWIAVPPPAYGGTEAVVAGLAQGFTDLGHEVVLFTVEDSTIPVAIRHLYRTGVTPMGESVREAAHVLAAYESLTDVDIVHDHTILGPLIRGCMRGAAPPVVTTNHGPFTSTTRRIFAAISRHSSIIAISADQARRALTVPIAAVIHHGVNVEMYRPSTTHGDYLVFIGRMSPDKGAHRAIRIARAVGRPLRLVTKMVEPQEHYYFKTRVRPLLSGEDELPEELPLAERIEVLAHAAALVNPISWDEPFGLVMAEALAAGTPVIAGPRGAAPEIVTDRLTGYLCADDRSAVRAVGELDLIDRSACRADAERRFSIQRMAMDHVALYERLLTDPLPRTDPMQRPLKRIEADGTPYALSAS